MKLTLLLFILNSAYASEIIFSFGTDSYRLDYSPEKIIYTTQKTSIQLIKKPCSRLMFEGLKSSLDQSLTTMPLNYGNFPKLINYTFNGTAYHEPVNSSRGRFLKDIPLELERLRRLEKDLCKEVPKAP